MRSSPEAIRTGAGRMPTVRKRRRLAGTAPREEGPLRQLYPALPRWANFCRAYGAGLVLLSGCQSVVDVCASRVTSNQMATRSWVARSGTAPRTHAGSATCRAPTEKSRAYASWVSDHESRVTSCESRRFGFVGFFVFDVALGVGVDRVLVGVGWGAADFAWMTHEEAAGRDFGALGEEVAGGDD